MLGENVPNLEVKKSIAISSVSYLECAFFYRTHNLHSIQNVTRAMGLLHVLKISIHRLFIVLLMLPKPKLNDAYACKQYFMFGDWLEFFHDIQLKL